ncbi:MAG: glycine oxidase ThiO [Gammaproteobacteria bacterium]|nr:glycine oxidase ThiO [Gammaproteobacteria bacterium]MBU1407342.1 glycine oxidase ThiO [Gammaproteobacteria bacterium]MBU1531455.1 glycine oxidase ThiO [Gammaproteobacteria bacterium]
MVILGAGVSGLSTALALLKRGHAVTLLDRGTAGGESSWAGGGILSPLLPWDYAEAVTSLALRSMAAYADWVADIETLSGRDAEFWRCGMLALDVADPERALAWCATHGMAAKPGSPQTVALPSSVSDRNPVWLPEVAQARNPRLVAALRGAVLQLGGTIHEHCPATGVLTQAGRVTAVQTPEDTFQADSVVLATGAWSGLGLAGLAATPHIRPIRGQMLLFKLEPGVLSTILYRSGLYLIPRRDGHVLAGSTLEDAGFDKATDAATLRRLHLDAAELLPALGDVQPVHHWAGLRPGSPGNIPVIDRHPDFDNVFVNAGHFRYGVTMAPASAELLADMMEGKAPALDPAPYRWQAAAERRWSDAP